MDISLSQITIAGDETHHLLHGVPLYKKKFHKVLKFHAPALAPVVDNSGAYHINVNGNALYEKRFLQTFGYYENLAAVETSQGWLHIDIKGNAIYRSLYLWCGNFQEGACPVKEFNTNFYYHINKRGERIYPENYNYVGDYRDGVAVVCKNGLHTHIDKHGNYIHGNWFLGLDVFHKSVARAKDVNGWFHVDKKGEALYSRRYKVIEPFYNNVAHAEAFDGSLLTIDLNGNPLNYIYQANQSLLHELSADLVGFWKTQTIYAAVKLGIFDVIPNSLYEIALLTSLDEKICKRLLRALQELELVQSNKNDQWELMPKGALLKPIKSSPMAAAAIVWGDSHYMSWSNLIEYLREPKLNLDYFNNLAKDKMLLPVYQQALSAYALHDYQKIMTLIDWSEHKSVIDAGGGTATLLHRLIEQYPHLSGILLEMPEVINLVNKHPRCNYYGVDILQAWPCQADAIIFARVLHDWPDKEAAMLLERAKANLFKSGKIYVLEMILDSDTAVGGLLDLNMLVMTNGKERSLQEWEQLAAIAQLNIKNIIQLTPIINILVLEHHANF